MIRVGILGPVGSGKTSLIEFLTVVYVKRGVKVGILTNDVVSAHDAMRIYRNLVERDRIIPRENLLGLVTGGCPHTAIREDPSLNIRALETLQERANPDIVFIESGGDNVMSTFSSSLADYVIFVLDTSAGDKYPGKGGIGITESDLLVVNKIDIAPLVNADLNKMREDAQRVRRGKPNVFVSLKTGEGTMDLVKILDGELGIEELLKREGQGK